MGELWSAIGLFAVVLAGLVLYTIKIMRKIGTPTRGNRIDPGKRPNTALVVIDVQEDFTRSTVQTHSSLDTGMRRSPRSTGLLKQRALPVRTWLS